MKFVNPNFKVNEDVSIFNIRQKEYDTIKDKVSEIIKPVEELGFTIIELDLKDSRFSSGELNKTLKQNLVIRLQKGNSEINLSMFIPKLVENYITINGRKKIPLFQLFDIPLVTRGNNIKLRTNVATLMIFEDKERGSAEEGSATIKVSFLGKKIPFANLMFAYYGIEELDEKYDFKNLKVTEKPKNQYETFLNELKQLYFGFLSTGDTQDGQIHEIGKIYSKYNAQSKGEDVMYALDLIPKVDPMSMKFFHTNTVIDELLFGMEQSIVDDTLLTNKRVRCFEYMILSKVSKIVFDLCMANRTARQPKFNVNSTKILSDCNVSDIVQFDFSINPIEELTLLSRISLLGPGGFKRENVPKHLRDILPSMMGRICPVDTPDRENCGILQNLIPNVKLDKNLRFSQETLEHQPVSIPVSLVPFLEHDDQTRLQMASSQMRQSVMLKHFDKPLIQSGCEGLYTDYTQFIKRAKKNGEVIYISEEYIIVAYDDKEVDVINISQREIYVSNMDFMDVYVTQGDKVKAGDIIAESNFCKDGNINFGKNLTTAIMTHYGNNYEDGIVISDRLVKEDVFTSIHFEDLSFNLKPNKVLLSLSKDSYKPLPDMYEKIRVGNPYAILKNLNESDYYSVFDEETKLEVKKNTIITKVNVFANTWNKDIPEFDKWINKTIKEQQLKEDVFKGILDGVLGKDDSAKYVRDNGLDKFSFSEKYKIKREKVNGVYISITGAYFRPIEVGDKIANRHGNKGVISEIMPHDKMPQLEDGSHVDICINPLGIISRMNIGQLYELLLSMSLEDLKKHLFQMLKDNKNQEDIKKYILDYIKIVDGTKTGWYYSQFENQLPKEIDSDFIEDLSIIQAPFESLRMSGIKEALKYTNTKFAQRVYDPLSKQHIINEIAVGNIYFFRMVHIAEDRLAARGIGSYARRTLQPLGGRKNKGGQRCGEMETACLIGHDAPDNLFEFLTTKSDCIDLKNRYIQENIEPSLIDYDKEVDTKPESVKLLKAYLTVIGVKQ